MEKRQIANHLNLALSGDEGKLKKKVEKLYKVLSRQPQRKVGRAIRKLKFVQTDRVTWQVILEREDAKQVEEIWYDFMDRKNLDGEWRIEMEGGKPKPTWRISQTFCFTFKRVPEKSTAPRTKKETAKAKPTVESVMNTMQKLSPEEKAEMLRILMGK